MNKAVQIIVTPSGERLAMLPEEEYLLLLAASEDDEGEAKPEFLDELRRRREALLDGGAGSGWALCGGGTETISEDHSLVEPRANLGARLARPS